MPRPSKKEEKVIAFLVQFAKDRGLNYKTDEIGNVLITKDATPGLEDRKKVILQSHIDMVCEKNADVEHDFERDPIQPYIDGDWVKARGTTLGADDGIGVAAQMAILASNNVEHGPLECLFTVDEETGLSGAFALEKGFMDGTIVLNLDSEDEGEMFIGCAGGIDTLAEFDLIEEAAPSGTFALQIEVKGLTGGHSGDDIHKGLANANKLLVRTLNKLEQKIGIRLCSITGGNLRNAIAREAKAVFLVEHKNKEKAVAEVNIFKAFLEDEYELTEPGLSIKVQSAEVPEKVLSAGLQKRLLSALVICPHGVHTMSMRMPGMVETSTNLASIKMIEGKILVTTSQRSDRESGKNEISTIVRTVFQAAGAEVRHSDGYPGWSPNPNSEIVGIAVETYQQLFGKEPVVRSIHAGLECGLFLQKYPYLDMVSFGPTIKGAHSPDERINIKTVEMFWKHLLLMLKNIPS